MKESRFFDYLGKTWCLFMRNGAWCFTPRWGDRGQKKSHSFRDKLTRAPFSYEAAEQAAKDLIAARFKGPDQYQALRDETKLRENLTVGRVLAQYEASGCQDRRRGRARDGAALTREKLNIKLLLRFWDGILASKITDAQRDEYRAHRRDTVRYGDGARATECELVTLNNALHWAWRTGLLRDLPRSMKTKYCDPAKVVSARDKMPESGDEAHALAWWCFKRAQAAGPGASNVRDRGQWECYGWAILLGLLTGLRRGELMKLLAKPERVVFDYQPGFMDDKFFRVRRVKKGRNPKIAVDDPGRPHLRMLIESIRSWHAIRYPKHRYLLPGLGPDKPLNRRGFARAIDQAAAALGMGKRCPHGLRAYYTSVRLAQGIAPALVAIELGQRSGDEMVREIYGVDPDDFDATQWTSLAAKFTWLPSTGQPAWHWWTAVPGGNIIKL